MSFVVMPNVGHDFAYRVAFLNNAKGKELLKRGRHNNKSACGSQHLFQSRITLGIPPA